MVLAQITYSVGLRYHARFVIVTKLCLPDDLYLDLVKEYLDARFST